MLEYLKGKFTEKMIFSKNVIIYMGFCNFIFYSRLMLICGVVDGFAPNPGNEIFPQLEILVLIL